MAEEVFGKTFFIKTDESGGRNATTISKDVYYFFHEVLEFDVHDKSHTVKVKEKYIVKEFALGFLRGFLDTD